ncbi:hypothetical protein BT69DRAFT_1258682 [Atractiella rhizophila]|nr:hypothetical protein BT69DRAFT_1258682 [Atractiella rhizophila]
MSDDMKGKYVTVSVNELLNRLPSPPQNNEMPAILQDAPDMSGIANKHYAPFIKYMSPFIHPDWELVNTSAKVDTDFREVLGVTAVKPDVTLYRYRGEEKTVMKKAEMFGEFETESEPGPFRDEKYGMLTERIADKARLTRDQITIYSTIVLSSQERTRSYSFFVQGHTARLLSHSRGGFEVTPSFDYVKTSHLREFFWRYTHASDDEDRGHDTTIKDIDKNDKGVEEARVKLNLQAGKPLLKVEVQNKVFYISDPFLFRHNQPVGRGTRCFEAYDPVEKRLVLLKDTWRHAEYPREGDIYAQLHEKGVPNILRVVAEGDVLGKLHRAKRLKDGKADGKEMAHYRIVLDKVGRPLSEFTSSYELVKGYADAFEAHFRAWEKLGMLHRDISSGNIILGPIEEGPKGYLIDWEFAKKAGDDMRSQERTGTYEFMSTGLLNAILSDSKVKHKPEDDIESFVYVLAWTVISHAQSRMTDKQRKIFLDKFRRMPQNDIESTIIERTGVITQGVVPLRLTTDPLRQLVKVLFQKLSYRLVPRDTLEDQVRATLDGFVPTENMEAAVESRIKEWTAGMTTHRLMQEVLQNALKDVDEQGTWRNLKDAAVPLEAQPHGSSKRRAEAMHSGRNKRVKSSLSATH